LKKVAFAGKLLGAIVIGFGLGGWEERKKRMLGELLQQEKDDSGAGTLGK